MTKTSKATRPAAEHPNNRFIGACIGIDRALEGLRAARANHFGVDQGPRIAAEAYKAEQIQALLEQALALATSK